jgi:hypothetical protein
VSPISGSIVLQSKFEWWSLLVRYWLLYSTLRQFAESDPRGLTSICLLRAARWLLGSSTCLLRTSTWLLGASTWLLGSSSWLLRASTWPLGSSTWLLGSSTWLLCASRWLLRALSCRRTANSELFADSSSRVFIPSTPLLLVLILPQSVLHSASYR